MICKTPSEIEENKLYFSLYINFILIFIFCLYYICIYKTHIINIINTYPNDFCNGLVVTVGTIGQ